MSDFGMGPVTGRPSAPAWEQPGPPLQRLWDTTIAVVLRPREVFAGLGSANVGAALAYAAIVGGITLLASALLELALRIGFGVVFPGRPPSGLEWLATGIQGAGILSFVGVQLAIFLARLFVWSLLAHGVLMLLGGAREPFETTLRVFCYAQAASIFIVIPFCGPLVALVWFLIVAVIGVSEAQRTDGMQAALAVLAPLVACCCCCGAGILTFMGSLAGLVASLSGARP
jgi:hypothetical protein